MDWRNLGVVKVMGFLISISMSLSLAFNSFADEGQINDPASAYTCHLNAQGDYENGMGKLTALIMTFLTGEGYKISFRNYPTTIDFAMFEAPNNCENVEIFEKLDGRIAFLMSKLPIQTPDGRMDTFYKLGVFRNDNMRTGLPTQSKKPVCVRNVPPPEGVKSHSGRYYANNASKNASEFPIWNGLVTELASVEFAWGSVFRLNPAGTKGANLKEVSIYCRPML